MLPEIKSGRVADETYNLLRRCILQRHFEPGERLNVDELAAQLNVSRTPVRDALNLLAAERLVKIVPRSGTYVAHLSPEDIEEVFDLRIALEGLAAERVAESSPSEEDLRELRRLAESAGKNDEDERIQHAETNRSFHERLVEMSGNRKLAQIYRTLHAHTMMALIHHSAPEWHKRWDLERQEHEAILAALEQGNPKAARRAVTKHIERSKRSLIKEIQRNGTTNELT